MLPTERLRGIEAFVATADAGSFTAAAERLHVTSSAVGKTIARLEARLGARLFERSTRRLRLTEAGEGFHRTCVRVLAELADAESVLAAHGGAPVGRLRVDAPATFGRLKVWPLLLQLADAFPHLRPQVTFSDRFIDLAEDGIDLAVRIGGPEPLPATLGSRLLGYERLCFCASPAYLEQHGRPRSSSDLADHDGVMFGRADGSIGPWQVADAGNRSAWLQARARLVVGSAEAQVAAVEAGFGIAQLATWLVDDALARGSLVSILPALDGRGLPLRLLWPQGRQLLPRVDVALERLAAGLDVDPAR
ncbi:LysR family transcriptional regulator [Stenotrophomonas maltophilia]|uniref:LysR family transcriptional regulator n=1 Tax=Stenotrophomonas maltophilia TaxID=40324 RepID=UPI0013D9ADE6|nr:LysR family transcriptional regulator [Stenotrophomonas maltophilia]MBA0282566.1 LysR family transcriptional regulator [Stenotrophomonas maltophilia]MBA0346682.1 LysR family transcriptional regulator [Stenotrophomonas maltophilia]MBA0358916.1 LysR family transcriptional regulator [Stenotrophomonas maltophilia]MBA0521004.1 LysR family transcriptional regulator [Stenotrophomonas maltophilia]